MNTAALLRDVSTRHGIYPAGLPVRVTGTPKRGKRRVCLDPHGIHLSDRCHAVTVPAGWLNTLGHRDPLPMAAIQVSEVVSETVGTWSRRPAA